MKSLDISDDRFEKELLGLPTPLAFIDFETMGGAPSPIPGLHPDLQIVSQFSCHTLRRHGLDWRNNIEHTDFLWRGDWGDTPIYAFVNALYEATKDAKTILIYSKYEKSKLGHKATVIGPSGEQFCGCVSFAREHDLVDSPKGFKVAIDEFGMNKVELTEEMVSDLEKKCSSMISRMYDQLDGVSGYIRSADLRGRFSIKNVEPIATANYSDVENLLAFYDIPSNGYEGLRNAGAIAKGDQCMSEYTHALNRPKGTPFPAGLAEQLLRYCCLDTLSMVIIYLAVLEQTALWRSTDRCGDFVRFPDGSYHQAVMNGDGTATSLCGCRKADADTIDVVSRNEFDQLDASEFFGTVCPQCLKISSRNTL